VVFKSTARRDGWLLTNNAIAIHIADIAVTINDGPVALSQHDILVAII
jgi:hypothetical protein